MLDGGAFPDHSHERLRGSQRDLGRKGLLACFQESGDYSRVLYGVHGKLRGNVRSCQGIGLPGMEEQHFRKLCAFEMSGTAGK